MNWLVMENNIIQEDIKSMSDFINTPGVIFTQWEKVREFEERWSDWQGCKYSVFVNSGASANLLTMSVIKELYGVGEVILPAMTWSSDVASVIHLGFTPVFVDIKLDNLAMNTDEVLSKITKNTKAIFLTHALGFNGLDEELLKVCTNRNAYIPLIEDCCEATGATFKGKKIGNFGLMSNFSFYYSHHLTTIEGGMVCTNDSTIYDLLLMKRSHGLLRECSSEAIKTNLKELYSNVNSDFMFAFTGFNFRNTEINAVLGLSQLKRLDSNIENRIINLRYFLELLDGSDKYFTNFNIEGNSSFCLPVILKNKDTYLMDEISEYLIENNVEFRRGLVSGNMLRQPFIKKYLKDANKFLIADLIHYNSLYVGNYPGLEKQKIKELCEFLNSL